MQLDWEGLPDLCKSLASSCWLFGEREEVGSRRESTGRTDGGVS